MSITDKTRKILWGRSGNRCAHCRRELLVDATLDDDASVVGDECHIVSGAPQGPRHDPVFPPDLLNEADNLLLLCRVHHKMVDDQHQTYTCDLLRQIKANHEAWVASSLAERSAPASAPRLHLKVWAHVRKLDGDAMVNIALRLFNAGRTTAHRPALRIYEVVDGPIQHFWWLTLCPPQGTLLRQDWDVDMMQNFDGPAYITVRSQPHVLVYPGDEMKIAHGPAGPKMFFSMPETVEIPLRGRIYVVDGEPMLFESVLRLTAEDGFSTDIVVPPLG